MFNSRFIGNGHCEVLGVVDCFTRHKQEIQTSNFPSQLIVRVCEDAAKL